MSRSACLLLLSASAAVLVCACGGDSQPARSQPPAQQCPPGQVFDGRYCVTQEPAAPATPTAAPDAGPSGGGAGPIPAVASPPACVALDATAASAATQLLAPLGAQYALTGAKPVGGLVAGQCQAGQGLETEVMLQPGRCYTVVGVGLPPVMNEAYPQRAISNPGPSSGDPGISQSILTQSSAFGVLSSESRTRKHVAAPSSKGIAQNAERNLPVAASRES